MTSSLVLLVAYGVVTSLAAPADVMCIHDNVTYTAGQQFKPDACTTCHCSKHGGSRPQCVVRDCTASSTAVSRLNCRRLVTGSNECCPRCEEPGCLFKGQFYAAGKLVSSTRCERCWCPPSGRGHVVCTGSITDHCPSLRHVNCVDDVIDPSTCCRSCPQGANCWLENEILRQGEIVDIGRCRKCQCPPEGQVMTYWRRVKGRQAICRVDKQCQSTETN